MLFSKKARENASPVNGSTTIIGTGVTLTGDINSTADIRIDGTLKGNIVSSARILVGAGGVIEGDLQCNQADVMGKIKGNIKTKEILSLRGDAMITGDIFAAKLQVEPTVNFNGRCFMSSNVVEMVKETNEKPIISAKAK
ncbi:bactofilin family protein [Aridibaculum aurantiacum]|uniref:bactofilin family protein n=1 Tax=Aridibaculum aurantiacum TaxID=2810307 RepID=UPI001A95F572|nr:polymer-forming cytoskeletal protein [Aridibaculum aurantiacum]